MSKKMTHEERVEQDRLIRERHKDDSPMDQELMYRVRKSNEMIQKGRHALTLREQRLLLYLISKIKETDTGDERYKINIQTAARILGCSDEKIGGKTYKEVFSAFATLRDKGFTMYTTRGTIVRCAFIDNPEQDQKGNMEFNFNRFVVPYLFDVKKQFTEFSLDIILPMKSSFGIRLYELLLSYTYGDVYTKDITVDELKAGLGANSESYAKYSLFKKYVLIPALNDLKNSNLQVDIAELKTGKQVTAIRFIITKKPMKFLCED